MLKLASSRCLAACSPVLGLLFAFAPGCDAGGASEDDEGNGGVPPAVAGSPSTAGGGSPGAAGAPAGAPGTGGTAGTPSVAGGPGVAGSSSPGVAGGPGSGLPGSFGDPKQSTAWSTTERYEKGDVQRNGVSYFFMANGWGDNWQSHDIKVQGTAFTITSLLGSEGPNWSPAGYPTVFCGAYSDSKSLKCGLPALLSSITSIKTGWSWAANGNTGQYNAAYDIWLGNTQGGDSDNAMRDLTEYLMVWYRDPPGQQPAGSRKESGITVPNVEGTWDYWQGQIGGKPYYAYVKPEGQDIHSLEFDVMDFVKDLPARKVTVKGNTVLSVAIGFEVWNGPITNLVSQDFYVDVK